MLRDTHVWRVRSSGRTRGRRRPRPRCTPPPTWSAGRSTQAPAPSPGRSYSPSFCLFFLLPLNYFKLSFSDWVVVICSFRFLPHILRWWVVALQAIATFARQVSQILKNSMRYGGVTDGRRRKVILRNREETQNRDARCSLYVERLEV